MSEESQRPPDGANGATPNTRLDSWKEIAAYLKRDVTTVRRWEKREGLPVHRHLHERRDSVYAFSAEIDTWWTSRRNHLAENGVEASSRSAETRGLSSGRNGERPGRGAWLPWGLAAAFFVATVVLAGVLVLRDFPRPQPDQAELRFSLLPPEGTRFGSVALSPNGRQAAFTASAAAHNGAPVLWVQPLDTLEARALPDTEDATFPFWSPAGDALGFFGSGKLWVVDLAGGSPRLLSEAPSGRGGTWNRDGTIVFAPLNEGPLFRIDSSGGAAVPISEVVRPDERGHLWPEFLPDGEHFIYFADSNVPEHHNLFVGRLGSADRTLLVPRASSNAVYGSNGYVFFARDREVVAQRFDPERLTLTGDLVGVVASVHEPLGADHLMDFSASQGGVLAYRSRQSPATRLVWRGRTQPGAALVDTPGEFTEPALSPDETQVAIAKFDPRPSPRFGYGIAQVRSDILILDGSTGAAAGSIANPAADWGPVWSPDGRRIVFSSNRSEKLELYLKNAFDGAEEELLPVPGSNPVAQSWSPDGKLLLYAAFDPKTHMDLWILPMKGGGSSTPLLNSEFSEMQGQVSPDGRWFAYTSNESGRSEVYVQTFPTPSSKRRISTAGGGDPRWRRDGKELFYIAEDRRLMAVAVRTGARFDQGPPVPLFDTKVPPHWYFARNLYDVSRDGRFLFMSPVEDDRFAPFTMVVNWPASRDRRKP